MQFFQTLLTTILDKDAKAEAAVAACPCLNRTQDRLDKLSPKAGSAFAEIRKRGLWMFLWMGALGLLLLLNLFIWPDHPHFGVDIIPWFWAAFGLGVGLAMVYVVKRIIQPLIVRKEDYYGDI